MWSISGNKKKWNEKKEVVAGKVAEWLVTLLVRLVRFLRRTEQRFSVQQKKRLLLFVSSLACSYLVWLFVTAILRPSPRILPDLRPDSVIVPLYGLPPGATQKPQQDSFSGTLQTKPITF
jgi:hypothetical protein